MGSGTVLHAAAPIVKSFDAPGAGTDGDTQQGTEGVAINDFGTIAGLIRDSKDIRHGFLRHPDGTFTVFDHPEAGTNGATEQGTKVEGIFSAPSPDNTGTPITSIILTFANPTDAL